MESLASEPLSLRLWALEEFVKRGHSLSEARILEDRLHAQRCLFQAGPIPKWTYHDVTLFATDPRDRHTHEARMVYIDSVYKALLEKDDHSHDAT